MPDDLQNQGPSPIPFTAPTPTIAPETGQNPNQMPPLPNASQGQATNPPPNPKSNKKTLIFVIIGLLILAILAAVIFFVYPKYIKQSPNDTPTAQVNPPSSSNPLPSRSVQSSASASPKTIDPNFTNGDFTITGPLNWTKTTNDQGALVLYRNTTADSSSAGQTFAANFNVISDPLAKTMTLDQYAKDANTQRSTTLTGYKLISQTKGALGGQTADIDIYTLKIGNIDVKQGQIYAVKNQKAYILTFSALPETWDNYAQIFNSSAQSFKFLGN